MVDVRLQSGCRAIRVDTNPPLSKQELMCFPWTNTSMPRNDRYFACDIKHLVYKMVDYLIKITLKFVLGGRASLIQTIAWWQTIIMMTSSNGNIFRVTGHLCGEFTGPGEFPTQRPVTRRFDVSLICVWINGWVNNREAGDLRRHRDHYDVNVMIQIMTLFIARVESPWWSLMP